MTIEDVDNIIAEISKLNHQGIQLCTKLYCEKIRDDFEEILEHTRQNRYVLPKKYAFVKRLQNAIYESFANNDINKFVPLFTIVETVRKSLGLEYELRRETKSEIRSIQNIIRQNVM